MARPVVPLVSRVLAVEAAVRVLDEVGLERFSMRQVGAELGVSGPALYHHFRDRDALLEAVAELLLVEALPSHPVSVDWGHCLVEAACTYRGALVRHPHAMPLLARLRSDAASLGYYAALFDQMRAAGLSDADIDTLVSGHLALASGAAVSSIRAAQVGAEPWQNLLASPLDDEARLRRACAAMQAGLRAGR